VLLALGAGWLSILGNSAGPSVHREISSTLGPVPVTLDPDDPDYGCGARATLGQPVRRVAFLKDGALLAELVCADGTDCIPEVSLPPYGSTSCTLLQPDGGAGGDAAADGLSRQTYRCTNDAGAPYVVRWTTMPLYTDYDACQDQKGVFELMVETAAGARTTVTYRIHLEQPKGYFGC
jgi:hypothetical protein